MTDQAPQIQRCTCMDFHVHFFFFSIIIISHLLSQVMTHFTNAVLIIFFTFHTNKLMYTHTHTSSWNQASQTYFKSTHHKSTHWQGSAVTCTLKLFFKSSDPQQTPPCALKIPQTILCPIWSMLSELLKQKSTYWHQTSHPHLQINQTYNQTRTHARTQPNISHFSTDCCQHCISSFAVTVACSTSLSPRPGSCSLSLKSL